MQPRSALNSATHDETVNYFVEDVAAELQQSILAQITDAETYLNLRDVCRLTRRLVNHGSSTQPFTFFSSYQPCSNMFILSPERMTASHVRAGNQLVTTAKDFLLVGNVAEADKILKKAMCRYGSHYAMQLIKMLGKLPGRQNLISNIDQLIQLYSDKSDVAIETECRSNLSEKNTAYILSDIHTARILFCEILSSLEIAFTRVYREDNGVSSSNGARVDYEYNGIQYQRVMCETYGPRNASALRYPELYTECFLGFEKDILMAWYHRTPNHMKFLKLETEINYLQQNLLPTRIRKC